MPSPEVSVVVICYNDAEHLRGAVASVLEQSLRRVEVIIADDCSTDDTPAIAADLAESDGRVRYLRLAQNSGGCGAPRNAGIDAARAPYVMFLDSDDTLEQHACYNLWVMAERERCDVVSGKCKRFHTSTRTWTTWYSELYAERRVLEDTSELPRIVYDSISTNMLYRKSFLAKNDLRFPVRVKYEDLQFTARVYASVARFGIIPETVYHWHIYPTAERRTITHDRSSIDNLRDRLNAIEVSRGIFAESNKPALLAALTDKLLNHDARITVDDASETDEPEVRAAILDTLDPHLRAVPLADYRRLVAMDRAAFAMALLRDREGMVQARLSARHEGAQAGLLVERGDRVLWMPSHSREMPAPGSLEESLCDITGDPILATPTSSLRLAHVITHGEPLRMGVRLHGITHDTFGRFTRDGAIPAMALRIRRRKGTGARAIPMKVVERSGGSIRWSVDIAELPDHDNNLYTRWWMSVQTTGSGHSNESHLCVDRDARVSFRETSGLTRALGAQVELYTTRLGDAALRRRVAEGAAEKPVLLLHKASRAWELAEDLTERRRADLRLRYYRTARRLPIYKRTVLFDSHMGRQFSDNPRAIYEELRRRDTDLNLIWDFTDPTSHPELTGRSIQRHTIAYADVVARAAAIVDNQGLPAWVIKRPDQFHLQTWHGTPLKRMALHKLENTYATPETIDRIVGEAAWDALVSPSEYFERTFVDSYRYTGDLIRGGTPRNDVLINDPAPDPTFVADLDLPTDRKIVLYAPTFREHLRDARTAAEVLLDLDRWIDELGSTHFLLIRAHYLNRFDIGRKHLPYVMDVSGVEEISDLYRAADMLVTDYSSVMFDYAWLDRPIVIFAPDYDRYVYDTRGTYFELRDDNPGLFCESQRDLHDLVAAAGHGGDWLPRLQGFRGRYCGVEDGKASIRAVDRLLAAVER